MADKTKKTAQVFRLETPLALSIVRAAAAELNRVGLALAIKSRRPLPCCMLGGLGTFYEPFLGKALRARLRPARYNSVQGALIMARAALTVRDKRRQWETLTKAGSNVLCRRYVTARRLARRR